MTSKKHAGANVLTKGEFLELLLEYGADNAGSVVEHVEGVMSMQNDLGRPTYVIEVLDALTSRDIGIIQDSFMSAGLSVVLLPAGIVDVTAQVTPESMGVENSGLIEKISKDEAQAKISIETIEREIKGDANV